MAQHTPALRTSAWTGTITKQRHQNFFWDRPELLFYCGSCSNMKREPLKIPQPAHAQPSAISAWDRHNNKQRRFKVGLARC
jgi:hypothetical protein